MMLFILTINLKDVQVITFATLVSLLAKHHSLVVLLYHGFQGGNRCFQKLRHNRNICVCHLQDISF